MVTQEEAGNVLLNMFDTESWVEIPKAFVRSLGFLNGLVLLHLLQSNNVPGQFQVEFRDITREYNFMDIKQIRKALKGLDAVGVLHLDGISATGAYGKISISEVFRILEEGF